MTGAKAAWLLDQFTSHANVANIHAAHLALNEGGLWCGTETFGYTGEDVLGKTTRRGLVAQRIVIDPRAAVRLSLSQGLRARLAKPLRLGTTRRLTAAA